ncbi:MAG: hypothetical protein ACK4MD_09625 [Demequina sp.]
MEIPLLPAAYDIAWSVVTILLIAAIVVTVVLLVRRSRAHREELAALRAEVDALKSTR